MTELAARCHAIVLSAILLAFFLPGCTRCNEPEQPSPPPKANRVVLVVIDTLRADGTSVYGYRKPTTPGLDKIAKEGIVFERLYSASPWTAPSFGTILTGVSPSVHRVGFRLEPEDLVTGKTLKVGSIYIEGLMDGIPILPDLLGDIPCGAVVNNAFVHPDVGLSSNFDYYDLKIPFAEKTSKYRPKNGERKAHQTTDAAISWLQTKKESPFFLMVHYFDPHISYNPPLKYRMMFMQPNPGRFAKGFVQTKAAKDGTLHADEGEKQQIRALYNGEVRFVDDEIYRLFEALKRLGMADNTWLMITADHGEEIFDHGGFDHGHRYEDEVTHVPLIIRAPGGKWAAGNRVFTSVRHIDLMPTILEWFGKKKTPLMEGTSLTPLITGQEKDDRPAYVEFNLFGEQQVAWFDGRYKLIQSRAGHLAYMYDLKKDPLEKNKLAPSEALRRELAARRKILDERAAKLKTSAVHTRTLTPDVEESLKALGYIEE